jgi:hypothetical protein
LKKEGPLTKPIVSIRKISLMQFVKKDIQANQKNYYKWKPISPLYGSPPNDAAQVKFQ